MNFVLMPLATAASAAAASSGAAASSSGNILSTLISLSPIILIFIVFYFMLIRPQRKREKDTTKMRNEIQVGDEITTVGGIVGRVVSIKDDTIVVETGADRSKIRIKKWAIQSRETIHDAT